MDVLALKRQGLTNTEIARELGYHPGTIARWLSGGGPPRRRRDPAEQPLIAERWATRIAELLRRSPRLLATSGFEVLLARASPAATRPSSATCASCEARALEQPRWRACPSRPPPVKKRSSTSPTSRPGRGAGGSGTSCASRRFCRGAGIGCGGSPPPRTASTPSIGWCASSRPWAGCPGWHAPTASGLSGAPRAGASSCTRLPSASRRRTAPSSGRARPTTRREEGKVERPYRDIRNASSPSSTPSVRHGLMLDDLGLLLVPPAGRRRSSTSSGPPLSVTHHLGHHQPGLPEWG